MPDPPDRDRLVSDRGDGVWAPYVIATAPVNSISARETIAVAEDGFVHVAWLQNVGSARQVWAYAESATTTLPPTRLDDGGPRPERQDLQIVARYGHTRIAWLEKPSTNELGTVVTRTADAGAWSAKEASGASVTPYLELKMAIDGFGNPAFSWEDGDLTTCGARKLGGTWTQTCALNAPSFTSSEAQIAVTERGRAMLSFYTDPGIGLALFE